MLNFENILTIDNQIILEIDTTSISDFEDKKQMTAGNPFEYDPYGRNVILSADAVVLTDKTIGYPIKASCLFNIIESYEQDIPR
jgi:hypothetical protein